MAEAPIRLLIVDDHPVVRDGLSGMPVVDGATAITRMAERGGDGQGAGPDHL